MKRTFPHVEPLSESLSVVVSFKIMLLGFMLEFGTTEKKNNLNEWKQHEAAVKGEAEVGDLESFCDFR